MIAEDLTAYRIPEAEAERCAKIIEASSDLDYDIVGELLDESSKI